MLIRLCCHKCRRIPSYELKYTLTSLSSKVDREYTGLKSMRLSQQSYCVTASANNQIFKPRVTSLYHYTLSEAWSGVNLADFMAAQGAFGTDFCDRFILRPKHHAYYRSGRLVIKIGPKGALGSHEIRPIHSKPRTEYR